MYTREEEIEEKAETFLESNYEGNFGVAVDLDYENNEGYLCVTFYGNDEFIPVAGFTKNIVDELGIQSPDIGSELNIEEGVYELKVSESQEDLPAVRTSE